MEESHDNNQQNGASLNEQVVERDLLQNNIIDQFGRSLGDYLAKVGQLSLSLIIYKYIYINYICVYFIYIIYNGFKQIIT